MVTLRKRAGESEKRAEEENRTKRIIEDEAYEEDNECEGNGVVEEGEESITRRKRMKRLNTGIP